MNELRENLIDRMIRIYGFENEIVIGFCRLCENPKNADNDLLTIVKAHEEYPVFEKEE